MPCIRRGYCSRNCLNSVACVAALWCFKNTDNFRDAILLATNLGHDADTVAAVTGQIAGAFYGMSGIPIMWLDKLYDTARFIELVDKLTDE